MGIALSPFGQMVFGGGHMQKFKTSPNKAVSFQKTICVVLVGVSFVLVYHSYIYYYVNEVKQQTSTKIIFDFTKGSARLDTFLGCSFLDSPQPSYLLPLDPKSTTLTLLGTQGGIKIPRYVYQFFSGTTYFRDLKFQEV